ncbi:MAG: BMP family ABC transporter substrate-binding protein [Anaerolineales bacterium]
MMRNKMRILIGLSLGALVLAACSTATPEPEEITVSGFGDDVTVTLPEPEEGKTNVAFVYIGPIGDAGWTYAHNQGREYLEQNVDNVHTVFLESILSEADAARVMRNLARKGFDAIIATSFEFQFPMPEIAEEFPDTAFLHVSGFLKNDENFGNLFGAMEQTKFLAGMVAGARAKEDGSNRVGYIAPWPIAEVVRLSNALTMGVRETCPECQVDVRWIFTWFDPDKEIQAGESLLDAGATVVVTGADTPGPVQAAGERGLWGIAYDSNTSCDADPEACLTVPYWNWGVAYVEFIEEVQAGTWTPSDWYPGAESGIVGLLGLTDGEFPDAVPEWVIPLVEEKWAEMQSGEFDRFDLFTGPIYDNKGNLVIGEGVVPTQEDLEGLDQATIDSFGLDREPCTICMNFLVEGFLPEAEIPSMSGG